MGTDERFERGDVEGDVFDAAVDVQIGASGRQTTARRSTRAAWLPYGRRVFFGHLTGVEPDTAARTDSPRHTGRVKTGDEADALVCTESGNELGPARLQILEGEPDAGMDVQHAEVPEPSTVMSALVTDSALWSMCRLLTEAARLAARH